MGLLDRILGPGDREAFAAEFVRAMKRAAPSEPVTYDAREFAVTVGKDGGVAQLHNVWSQVEHASRVRRGAAARGFARTVAVSLRNAVPDRWEDAAPRLLPKIRSRLLYPLAELRRSRGTPMPATWRPF